MSNNEQPEPKELSASQIKAQKRQERLLAKSQDRLAKLTGGSKDRIVSENVENKPIVKKASQEIDDPDEIDLSEVVNKSESSNKDNSEDIKNKENIVKENVANGDEDVNANELKVLDELLYQQTSTPQHQQQSQQRINLKALAYIRILRYFTVIFITLYAINQSSNLPWHESFSVLASINPDFKISDLPAIDFFPLWTTLLSIQIVFYSLTYYYSPQSLTSLPKLPEFLQSILESPLVPSSIITMIRWMKLFNAFIDDIALSILTIVLTSVIAEYIK